MKIEVKPSWHAFQHVVTLTLNGKTLSYEGGQTECEQLAKSLRARVNRSGKKTKKTLDTATPVLS